MGADAATNVVVEQNNTFQAEPLLSQPRCIASAAMSVISI
jgi:hypothetical protein